jgi:hypothetical protein
VKTCNACGISKPVSEFYKHAKSRDGRYNECKECRRLKCRQWWLENRSKDARKCRWCGKPLERYQRKYHQECRKPAELAQRNEDTWQCSPGKCRYYSSCVITVRMGARLPCQPVNVEPIPVHSLEVISAFSGISLR